MTTTTQIIEEERPRLILPAVIQRQFAHCTMLVLVVLVLAVREKDIVWDE